MLFLEGGNLVQKEKFNKIIEGENDNLVINILACNNDINNRKKIKKKNLEII